MATSKEAIQSDPLAMLMSLVGKTAQGLGQGVYQDPNTGARNFSVLQGGAGALAGAGEGMLAMKEFKLKEDVMKQQMDIQERQMKIAEQQHKQQQAEFARQQEAINLQRQREAETQQSDMMKTGYGSVTTEPTVKYTGKRNPKTGELEKTLAQKTYEWGLANEGKPLPTRDIMEKSQTPGMSGSFAAGPLGWMSSIGKKETTAAVPVPIVPGSNADGSLGKIDVRAIRDVDHMKRIGQAIATDPSFTPADRSRLLAEWKGEMARAARDQFSAATANKEVLDAALNNKQITPEDYTKISQLFGEIGARKDPEIVHKANQFLVHAFSGNGQGMISSFMDTMQSLWTRANPLADTMYRMNIPAAGNFTTSPAQLVQQGKPVYTAGKATKGKK